MSCADSILPTKPSLKHLTHHGRAHFSCILIIVNTEDLWVNVQPGVQHVGGVTQGSHSIAVNSSLPNTCTGANQLSQASNGLALGRWQVKHHFISDPTASSRASPSIGRCLEKFSDNGFR